MRNHFFHAHCEFKKKKFRFLVSISSLELEKKYQISVNGKKFKRILSCLFDGTQKLKLLNSPSTTSSLSLVLLPTQSAQRLISSPHLAVVLRPNLAELVPSGFLSQQPWFLRRLAHIFARKTPMFIVTQ